MRKVVPLTCISMCSFLVANSQKIVLTPQIGVQTFQNEVQVSSTFPGHRYYTNPSPTAGLRLNLISKKGHGPYIGINVGDMSIPYRDTFTFGSRGMYLRRFEAGYQWTTKPVYFKRLWDNQTVSESSVNAARKDLAVQIQPSFGLTYIRGVGTVNNYSFGNAAYSDIYYSGNFGLNAGVGFVFSHNNKQKLSLSINYTKGLWNIYSSVLKGSNYSSYEHSRGSGFNFSLGVPITLFKKK